jgi:hypothetical protein
MLPLKDSLLAVANKVSLERDDVVALKKIAEDRHAENPSFCWTLGVVCEHLLNPWAKEKAQELLEPIRLFIQSSDNRPEFCIQAANTLTRILTSLKN